MPLSPEEREELGRHLRWEIDRYNDETQPRRSNVEQWRRDWELYPQGPSTRWRNASNVTSPLTHIYCTSHHTRLNQQIVKADPPFSVVAKSPFAQTYVPDIEEAITSLLDAAEWEEVADQVHGELPIVGNCMVRTTYEQVMVHAPHLVYDWDEDLFDDLVAGGGNTRDALFGALRPDKSGQPAVELAWQNRVIHEGVRFKVIPWEDCVVLPASVRDPEEARGIGERLMIRGVDLRNGARQGKYIDAAVKELLERQGDEQPADRSERLMMQGMTQETGFYQGDGPGWRKKEGQNPAHREYLCYEICWQDDFNDDGDLEWVVITFHYETGIVLRCQWLAYEHGRPYYTLFRYYTRTRELWGMSVAEKLASIQDTATAVLNQLIDHADLCLNLHGNFFYDGTSGFDPARNPARLGRPIRVENVDGIKLVEIAPLPPEHYNIYQLLKDMADLVTATSNPSLGRATDTAKTLGEVQIVQGASSMIFEEVASRISRCWAKVLDQFRWLEGQYGENGEVKYRATARPGKLLQRQDAGAPGGGASDPMGSVGMGGPGMGQPGIGGQPMGIGGQMDPMTGQPMMPGMGQPPMMGQPGMGQPGMGQPPMMGQPGMGPQPGMDPMQAHMAALGGGMNGPGAFGPGGAGGGPPLGGAMGGPGMGMGPGMGGPLGQMMPDPLSGQDPNVPAAMVGGQYVPAPGGYAFAAIPSDILLADVDIVPAGLSQIADMASRVQRATIVQNTALAHPLTANNPQALSIIFDEFLQAVDWPKRRQIMGEVQKALDSSIYAAQMQMAMQMLLGSMGGPVPGNEPEQQGPKGQTGAQPTQAPRPNPQGRADATAEATFA